MNRISILIAKVKAEAWIGRIKREHAQKFQPIGGMSAPVPQAPNQTQQQAAVPSGQPDDQSAAIQQPVIS